MLKNIRATWQPFAVWLLFFLGGCVQKKPQPKNACQVATPIVDPASLTELPLPPGVIVYNIARDLEQTAIHYEAPYVVSDIYDFYKREMAQLGWHALIEFPAAGMYGLLFEKPRKWCIVHVTEREEQAYVTVFVGLKASEYLS